jgi:hypothetical protein
MPAFCCEFRWKIKPTPARAPVTFRFRAMWPQVKRRRKDRERGAAPPKARVFRLPPLLGRRLNLGFRLDKKQPKRRRMFKARSRQRKGKGEKGGEAIEEGLASARPPALLTGTHLSSNAPTRGIYLLAQLIGLRE